MTLRTCACIDTLYTELPWQERFQAAKNDGFDAVEFWDWRPHPATQTVASAQKAGIVISGFNGDGYYSLIDPMQKQAYLQDLHASLNYATSVGAKSVTIHSNALGAGGVVVNAYDHLSHTVKLCAMYDTLLACVKLAEQAQIKLHLEALNVHVDHVGNFLQTTQMGAEICALIDSPWLKLLYDVYHMQYNEGSVCQTIATYGAHFGHVHIADVPGRHEPGTGELNVPNIIAQLEAVGYAGYVGYELFPKTHTKKAVTAIFAGRI